MTSIFRITFALAILAVLNSCGGGAVGGPPPVNDPTRITLLPATVTAFSGLPTVFTVSGGTGAYIVSSSNQAIVPISGSINGSTFTVVPNPVVANTTVTLTVRDTGTTPAASATITVQPGTVNNNVTITPTSTQAAACSPAICSGGDALVSVTISQGGIPLAARGVRFDAVTGSFSFVTTVNGVDSLTSTVTVVTDETGKAIARIRIPANAANQSALIQITDLGTGTFVRTSFTIAQSTGSSPGFSVLPSGVVFQGPNTTQCAGADNTAGALFTIIGGVPPYTVISGTSAFTVFPPTVSTSGGTFVAKPNGTCSPAPGTTLIVTDSSGHTATATAQNIPGTTAAPDLAVAPDTVTLSSCTGSASVRVAGGVSSTYFASEGSDALNADVSGNTVTISRKNPSSAPGAGPLSVGVSDGSTVATITVNLTGDATGACSTVIHASPSSVTLTDCTTPTTVTLSGGTGPFTSVSDNASVGVTATGARGETLTISRVAHSGAFTPPASISITNGSNSTQLLVNASTSGSATCP
jgi:hypothetical protein